MHYDKTVLPGCFCSRFSFHLERVLFLLQNLTCNLFFLPFRDPASFWVCSIHFTLRGKFNLFQMPARNLNMSSCGFSLFFNCDKFTYLKEMLAAMLGAYTIFMCFMVICLSCFTNWQARDILIAGKVCLLWNQCKSMIWLKALNS